jgi:hypothetical protein
MVNRYKSLVSEQYVPYIMPQEHGHKTDVRWFRLFEKGGNGIQVEGVPTIEFSASNYSDNDLYSACHTYELQKQDEIFLNIDKSMRGLGTGSCGPDTLDKYRLFKSRFTLAFIISPIKT